MANLTFLEISKMAGADQIVGLIENTIEAHPELLWPGRTIAGTEYKTLIRNTLPGSGFRQGNQGSDPVVSVYSNKLVETFIWNPRIEMDVAVAMANEDGADAAMAIEAAGVVESSMINLASQAWYGRATTVATSTATQPTDGFPGLVETYNTAIEVDLGGVGADTSSVWAVRTGVRDVSWVWGRGGMLDLSEVTRERILDGSSNPFTAFVQEILAFPGLQQVNINSAGRIKNVDTGTGLTDDNIANLLSLFPTGVVPDALYMSRRSLRLLRASRVATISSGGTDRRTAVPFPDESMGIPIHVTDALVDTENAT